MQLKEVFELLRRDCAEMLTENGVWEKLTSGRRLRIKFGADPSRPDLHIGHSVVLRRLRMLQVLGHEICFVIGDFTGMVGDPSGRSKTRPALRHEETTANGRTYFEQVAKILDTERATIVYNSEWLSGMRFGEVLALAEQYTVARILERDDFSKRMRENRPIGMHELFYPLMQGYDSVALRADIEVGGTDQTFNLLVGRDLQRARGMEAQEVITFPLLPGLDGTEKMSKSLDNYIGLTDPPAMMYEKAMRVPDALLPTYMRLTTDLQPSVSQDAYEAHKAYAHALVTLYHGADAASSARAHYSTAARGAVPEPTETVVLTERPSHVAAMVCMAGVAPSASQARILIAQGGIRIDGMVIRDALAPVPTEQHAVVLSRGKGKHVRVIWPE